MKSIINLYRGDSLEAMKAMPVKKYDLAIVDPPYGINNNVSIGRRKGDNAPVSIIELTAQREVKAAVKGKKAAKKKGAQTKPPEKSEKK